MHVMWIRSEPHTKTRKVEGDLLLNILYLNQYTVCTIKDICEKMIRVARQRKNVTKTE
jgi:hypothetical protein